MVSSILRVADLFREIFVAGKRGCCIQKEKHDSNDVIKVSYVIRMHHI